ncbi:hypothetical protein ACSS6W_007273 [Trichoderma asperelloides]
MQRKCGSPRRAATASTCRFVICSAAGLLFALMEIFSLLLSALCFAARDPASYIILCRWCHRGSDGQHHSHPLSI